MIVRQQSTGPVPPDSNLASFRESYRSREIGMGYNGWVHALIVLTGSLVSIGLALSAVQDPTFLELLAIPITLLIANIVEYFGHRGPMHEPMRGMYALFERHAKVHHQFFDEQWMSCESSRDHHIVLFPPLMLVFYLGLIALPLATIVYTHHNTKQGVSCLRILCFLLPVLRTLSLHISRPSPEQNWASAFRCQTERASSDPSLSQADGIT